MRAADIVDVRAEPVSFSGLSLRFIKGRLPEGSTWPTFCLWGSVEKPAGNGTQSQWNSLWPGWSTDAGETGCFLA